MDVGRLEFVLAPAFLTDTFSGSSSLSCQRIDGILDRRPDVLVKALYGASIYVHTRSLLVYERGCQALFEIFSNSYEIHEKQEIGQSKLVQYGGAKFSC